ncbi:KTSC domain-containing protein [Duganella sp. FT94W]|uniref:KTSC domain-containing protein n=1 Tax=Duganella lactea TaxID=2692173 RepID=A0ABW9V800_9BURK|nr:KTSC domain-containing protein [Duganella lactea]MYM34882.1 KTSC domain-containing protein [Duganella lactea]
MHTANSIPLIKVASSKIAAIGHDAATNTLAIQFLSKGQPGNVYHYGQFSAADYDALEGAESIGKHFIAHIQPAKDKYPYVNMGLPSAPPVDPAAAKLVADHALALAINAECYGDPLPGGQRYSRTTFKDTGYPILLDADGKRSVFCDLNDDVEQAA